MTTTVQNAPANDAEIGRAVQHGMWERGWTQTYVADMLGTRQEQVSKALRGKRGWTAVELQIMAQALGTTVDGLIERATLLRSIDYYDDVSAPGGIRTRQPSDPKSDTPVDKRYSGNIPAARQPNTTGIQITESGTAAVPVSGRVAYLESTPNSSDQTIIIPRQFGAGRRIC